MASEPRLDQPPPSPETSGDAEPRAPPPRKAPLGLLGLTEEAALELLSRLDMVGLATVRRVCRRLHRIASDPSLLARVSVVQWTGEAPDRPWRDDRIAGAWSRQSDVKNRFLTNCAQLGSVQMPWEAEAAAEKFLSLLEWLLAGGAEVVSLQKPGRGTIVVVPRLSYFLKKHKVELKALACLPEPAVAFLEMVRSQPTLTHICLHSPLWMSTDGTEVAKLVRCLPGLRHLSLMEPCLGQRAHWVRPGLPVALAAQLRSILVVSGSIGSSIFLREVLAGAVEGIRESSAGRLLLRAVGHSGQGSASRGYAAFAVEDFRAEGKLGDPWDGAHVALPEPTLDARLIQPFLQEVARRQEAEERELKRQKAEEERERLQKNKADGKMLKWEAKEESKTEAAKGTKTLVE